MASLTASSHALSQCRVVAGSATCLSFSESAAVRGKYLAPAAAAPRRCRSTSFQIRAMAPKKKVNAFDSSWEKKFFGYGYFAESSEDAPVNITKTLEKKRLLTGIEKAGLLSKAESLGFSLKKIEALGLLSKAEGLGLLALAENFASSSPAVLASLSLPLFVGALATPILVPDDNSVLLIGQYAVASLCLVGGLTLFLGSIVLGILQED